MYVNGEAGGYLEVADGVYPVTPNRAHFVPAWVRIRCRNPEVLRHFYVHFDTVGVSSSVLRRVFTRPLCSDRPLRYKDVAPADLCEAQGVLRKDLPTYCHVKSLVYREFLRLFSVLPDTQAGLIERLVTGRHEFAPVIEYIDDHLSNPLSNDLLARIRHMSKSHFIRRFHKLLGQTPAEYVRERRVASAAIRLIFTDESIETIAASHGFPNRYYFSRVFKALTGIPPAAYRKRPTV
jgi:AraC-like DNA-binding protein